MAHMSWMCKLVEHNLLHETNDPHIQSETMKTNSDNKKGTPDTHPPDAFVVTVLPVYVLEYTSAYIHRL